MDINKQCIRGRLGEDPKRYRLKSEADIVRLTVATHHCGVREDGTRGDITTWHTVVLRGIHAENALKHLSKGDEVYVEGRTEKKLYFDRNGARKYFHQVEGEILRFANLKKSQTKSRKRYKGATFSPGPDQASVEVDFNEG